MNFADNLKKVSTEKRTEKGDLTYNTSLNDNLDYFALAGAMRNREDSEITQKFSKAFREDKELALRNLVYLRDIRNGGKGERKAFRASLKHLDKKNHRYILNNLVRYVSEIGRWDDVVFIFRTTDNEQLKSNIANYLRNQLNEDMKSMREGKDISLLAKWMPSINASSQETKSTARELISFMYNNSGSKNKVRTMDKYRKTLSTLREYLNIVEKNLSEKEYENIDYSKVPSRASIKYRQAFFRNDEERYGHYLEDLEEGKTKVNASVTYPYEIVREYVGDFNPPMMIFSDNRMEDNLEEDTLLEEAWKSLPNYMEDTEETAIVVADTSGSMMGDPINVSVSLAIYCAERLKGDFKGKYLTFSREPAMMEVSDEDSLLDNLMDVMHSDWGMNTDLNAVFELILGTAVKYDANQEEIPDKIVVISDMEFDYCSDLDSTTYESARRQFESQGYKIPQIIFWNVDARNDTLPVRKDDVGTSLVSGLTPAIFKEVLGGDVTNPEKMMLETLNQEKFDFVRELL